MDLNTILTLVSLVLVIISSVLGSRWLAAKGKMKQFVRTLAEGYDVVDVCVKAIEDNKITPEEVAEIKQEAAEFKAAFKLLMAKDQV